jgi:hypothetical protein
MIYKNGKPIEKAGKFELQGELGASTSTGTFHCPTILTMEAETADAKVTGIDMTVGACVGTGAYLKCKIGGVAITNLPYTAHPELAQFRITNLNIDYLKLTCLSGEATLSIKELIAAVDNPKGIKSVTLSGIGTLGGAEAEVFGELEVVGESSGAYSLAE